MERKLRSRDGDIRVTPFKCEKIESQGSFLDSDGKITVELGLRLPKYWSWV